MTLQTFGPGLVHLFDGATGAFSSVLARAKGIKEIGALSLLRVVSASKAIRGGVPKLIEDQRFIFRIWFLQPWSTDRYVVRSHLSISLSK